MKLPSITFLMVTNYLVQIRGEPNESGAKEIVKSVLGKCNFSYKSKRIYTKEGQKLELKAKAIIDNPELFSIEDGTFILVDENKMFDIEVVWQINNPDGSIHHVELGLV